MKILLLVFALMLVPISVHALSDESKAILEAYWDNRNASPDKRSKIIETVTVDKEPQIDLVIKKPHFVQWKHNFVVSGYLFDPEINTRGDYYFNDGKITNATITGKIKKGHVLIHNFTENTSNNGYFTNAYYFQDNSKIGQYIISLTASKQIGNHTITDKVHESFFVIPLSSNTFSTPSEPIDDLKISSENSTSVMLSWTQPNLNGGILPDYHISFHTPHGIPDTILDTTTDTSHTVTGLEPDTEYSYSVQVITNGGTSEPSNIENTQTMP